MNRPRQGKSQIFVGTAAWSVPSPLNAAFAGEGTHLQRYSQVLNAVEINTSFYRHHKPETYRKWADSTPDDFRFSVKLSKVFTHEQRLKVDPDELSGIISGIKQLGEKFAVLLVQIPPSLDFDVRTASAFFSALRKVYTGPLVFEARHQSWFTDQGFDMLRAFNGESVRADPNPCPVSIPKTSVHANALYYRWHGSPVIYESRYDQESLTQLAKEIRSASREYASVWCIFDNTKFFWATTNALEMKAELSPRQPRAPSEASLSL